MDQEKFYTIEECSWLFFTEMVLYKQKQLDDTSLRRIKISFSGWSRALFTDRANLYLE